MKKRLLVIDDQAGIRMLVKEVLEAEGYQVETTSDGEEFLNKLSKQRYDLLIMDLMVPGYSGTDFLQSTLNYAHPSQIMIITGLSCSNTKSQIKNLGISTYLEKPFDLKELKNEVQTCLDQITA